MARSMWKGYLKISMITFPIKMFTGDDDEKTHFNQLHSTDQGAVGYDKRCKVCNAVVSADEIVKGYQWTPGQFVIIEAADLKNIKLSNPKILDVETFVPIDEIPPSYYTKPYLLGPDGPVAGPTYGLLVKAMEEAGVAAISKQIIRERENPIAIISHEGALVVHYLRYPAQLRPITDIPDLDKVPTAVAAPALELAGNLIGSMTKSFVDVMPTLVDRYEGALKVMIEDKIAGKIPEIRPDAPPPPQVDIMAALQASIAANKATTSVPVPTTEAPAAAKTAKKPAAKATKRSK